jgi:hypothetical protein
VISKEQFINEIIRAARENGYKIESSARTGETKIDFGNKKLHAGHLAGLYPAALSPHADIASLIESLAPGRPCTHKPMKEIIEQLRSQGKL